MKGRTGEILELEDVREFKQDMEGMRISGKTNRKR
ncbi:MAG: hypothetical protein K0R15_563 [Clostridiales bacterium]|jgi:hypothetical protein|nr:hypothetical protein [Clostridiales bacterium]